MQIVLERSRVEGALEKCRHKLWKKKRVQAPKQSSLYIKSQSK